MNMDPTTLRSYIESARYSRDQAEQTRQSYEQQAQTYEDQANAYEEQAEKYRKYALETRVQSQSYNDEVVKQQGNLEYYLAQISQVEQDAEFARLNSY